MKEVIVSAFRFSAALSSLLSFVWIIYFVDSNKPAYRMLFFWTSWSVFLHSILYFWLSVCPLKHSNLLEETIFSSILSITASVSLMFWSLWLSDPSLVIDSIKESQKNSTTLINPWQIYPFLLCQMQHTIPFLSMLIDSTLLVPRPPPALAKVIPMSLSIGFLYLGFSLVCCLYFKLWQLPYPFMLLFTNIWHWVGFVIGVVSLFSLICICLHVFRSLIVQKSQIKQKTN